MSSGLDLKSEMRQLGTNGWAEQNSEKLPRSA